MVSSVLYPGDAAAFITQFRYSGGGGRWRGWVKNQSYSIKTLNDFLLQFFLCVFLKRLTSTSQLLFFLGRRFLLYMLRSLQYYTMNLCPLSEVSEFNRDSNYLSCLLFYCIREPPGSPDLGLKGFIILFLRYYSGICRHSGEAPGRDSNPGRAVYKGTPT